MNIDETVGGIIVQLPLFDGWDVERVQNAIDPRLDIDGFHKLTKFLPATPRGMIDYLKDNDFDVFRYLLAMQIKNKIKSLVSFFVVHVYLLHYSIDLVEENCTFAYENREIAYRAISLNFFDTFNIMISNKEVLI